MKKNKTLSEYGQIMKEFADVRGWSNENPTQLFMALTLELAELGEHYQWKNKFEVLDEDKKREIGYEFVDVFNYLIRMAERSGIDIEKYFDEKMPKLAKKFPIGATIRDHRLSQENYRKTGKNKLYD